MKKRLKWSRERKASGGKFKRPRMKYWKEVVPKEKREKQKGAKS